MASYLVRVNVLTVDKQGKNESKSWEYNFNDSSKKLLDLRYEAISKAKSMKTFFEDEMPEDIQFSSPKEAEMSSYKDFRAYSINIVFINDENDEEVLGCFFKTS
ncbi:MAG TPA: hypothetical protein PL028_06855 [Bacteroidales bacterium]|nr:hypothetical protein [Bacteroidales bacterium]